MSEPDPRLERLLGEALDAQARASVGDAAQPPPPRYVNAAEGLLPGGGGRHHRHAATAATRRRARWAAPLAAAAAVAAVAATAVGISLASDGSGSHAAGSGTGTVAASPTALAPVSNSSRSSGSASATAPAAPVHIKLLNTDGAKYGVGMPVIAFFSRKITSAKALQAATTVTVDGKSEPGGWYFETSDYFKGYPIEGHFRLENYWPAHSKVFVTIPAKGLSAGRGMAFDDNLTSSWSTGPADVATVSDTTHKLTLLVDGRTEGSYPVSLGAPNTPTAHGTKVIMDKGLSVCMSGPGYDECGIKDTQRLTYGGEYLHSAPWNVAHIKAGVDSSNGCTNLLPADAAHLYRVLSVGDVVKYPSTDGPQMSLGAGYGDWNVPWGQWLTGGLVPTR